MKGGTGVAPDLGGKGALLADACGTHAGTLVNSPQWVPSLKGSAILLNGTDQYFRLNNGPILNQDAAFTIEACVNWSGFTNSAGQAVIYCEATKGSGLAIDTFPEAGLCEFAARAKPDAGHELCVGLTEDLHPPASDFGETRKRIMRTGSTSWGNVVQVF